MTKTVYSVSIIVLRFSECSASCFICYAISDERNYQLRIIGTAVLDNGYRIWYNIMQLTRTSRSLGTRADKSDKIVVSSNPFEEPVVTVAWNVIYSYCISISNHISTLLLYI